MKKTKYYVIGLIIILSIAWVYGLGYLVRDRKINKNCGEVKNNE